MRYSDRKKLILTIVFAVVAVVLLWILYGGEHKEGSASPGVILYTADGERVKTLDPVLASDLASSNIVTTVFDTLLQYDYIKRPYILKPSMLETMPEVKDNYKRYIFTLRDDLYFHPDRCFGDNDLEDRRVTSDDVIFSILRLADARLHSSAYWLVRGKIAGIDNFRTMTLDASEDDYSVYDVEIAGLRKLNDRQFEICLEQPDPRFLYILAMPGSAVVSRKAVEYYGDGFAENPVGSGPFMLKEWLRDHHIIFDRYPDFREEYFKEAEKESDRTRKIPLADRLVC